MGIELIVGALVGTLMSAQIPDKKVDEIYPPREEFKQKVVEPIKVYKPFIIVKEE